MKILYIGPKMLDPRNGGDAIELRNQTLLEKLSKEVTYFSPDFKYNSIWDKFRITIGLTSRKKKELKSLLNQNFFNVLFVSQSTYGGIVKFMKGKTKCPIVTFFHNAEIDYYLGSFKGKLFLKGLNYFIKVAYCEYYSAKLSDIIITLNERDSLCLKKYYGRCSDYILPTSFEDVFDNVKRSDAILDIDCLFVGSAFYANTDGLQWYIDKVLPYVSANLYIVGNGMDKYQFKNVTEKVYIKGFVDDLSEYYLRSKVVISPIFSGAGMKTKTAEALMYGKTIIGTKEAFEGYIINDACMRQCNTPQEFISELNEILPTISQSVNMNARTHFLNYYSNESALAIFKNILLSFDN